MAVKATWLERMSGRATAWTGSSWALAAAAGVILVWAATGPYYEYGNTWQLVINTGTTVVTFLMVFLIQRSQNKDSLAVQLKLNELVAAVSGASNRLINVEDLSEKEIHALQRHYRELVKLSKGDEDITCSHSVEEAKKRHEGKRGRPAAAGDGGQVSAPTAASGGPPAGKA